MAEYIEREAAIKAFKKKAAVYGVGQGDALEGLYVADCEISACPAADVAQVVHGRWITWEEAGNYVPSTERHECSVCHDSAQFLVNRVELLSPYCPNCGAKMDGERIDSNG